MRPVRVVAPTRVKGGSSRRIERAAGPLAQHDVQLEVLHGRVEDLFDGPGQPVDLVDEEHVAGLEPGQDGGQVAGPLEGGARGDLDADAHLVGDDAGQGGLAQARADRPTAGGRRAGPAGAAASRTIDEVLLDLGLTDELVERAGAQARVVVGDLVHHVGHGLLRERGSRPGRRRWAHRPCGLRLRRGAAALRGAGRRARRRRAGRRPPAGPRRGRSPGRPGPR